MTAINSVLAQTYAALAQATQAAESSQAGASQNTADAFGSAVNVTLSPAAQAATGQNASPATTTSSASGSASGTAIVRHSRSPHVPVTTSSSTSDTATLVQEAMQQVIPKVGVTGASEVVDSNGNIDQGKLQQLIDQQELTPPVGQQG